MTTKELIDQYVTAHAENRWMDASELETLLTEFAEKLDNLEEQDDKVERIKKAIKYAIGQSTHSGDILEYGITSTEAYLWFCEMCNKNN